jgi:hypothetical protein
MANSTHKGPTTQDEIPDSSDVSSVERLEQMLEEWRVRIDELLVQADLASKDVSEAVHAKVTLADNAYLAAVNRLKQLPRDAGANLASMQAGFDKLVADIREAYQSAEAVIRRGPLD